MLNSGEKNRALCDKKNKYSNSRVVRKKYFLNEKKSPIDPPPPTLHVKWSVSNQKPLIEGQTMQWQK